MTQLSLLAPSIQERFEQFHAKHPEVYAYLVEQARSCKNSGRIVGIRMLWERARWEFYIERGAGETYKFQDHFTSRYSRLIAEQEPDLRGYFEQRGLRA